MSITEGHLCSWLGLSPSPGLLIQAVGRVLRRHPGKARVFVHDYVDSVIPVLAHQYTKRRAGYRQMGFQG